GGGPPVLRRWRRVPRRRDRRDDVAPIARHFLRTLAGGEAPPLLAPDALARLAEHDWPGNVRELRNVIERALARHPRRRVLGGDDLTLTPMLERAQPTRR